MNQRLVKLLNNNTIPGCLTARCYVCDRAFEREDHTQYDAGHTCGDRICERVLYYVVYDTVDRIEYALSLISPRKQTEVYNEYLSMYNRATSCIARNKKT